MFMRCSRVFDGLRRTLRRIIFIQVLQNFTYLAQLILCSFVEKVGLQSSVGEHKPT